MADLGEHWEQVRESAEDNDLWLWALGVLTALTLWWFYLAPKLRDRRPARPEPITLPPEPPEAAGSFSTTAAAAATPVAAAERPAEAGVGDSAPPVEGPDDLTLIVGLGPANAAYLRAAGLDTFVKLAAAEADHVKGLVRGVSPDVLRSWAEQARLAASHDWDGLAAYQAELRVLRTRATRGGGTSGRSAASGGRQAGPRRAPATRPAPRGRK